MQGEKNIYWRTFWSHKSNRAFLFRLKFQSIVHRFYACIYDVTYYLSLSTFGLTYITHKHIIPKYTYAQKIPRNWTFFQEQLGMIHQKTYYMSVVNTYEAVDT